MNSEGVHGRAINVGSKERLVSIFLGAALAGAGIKRRGWGGAFLAIGGLAMMGRGATGRCGLYEKLGIDSTRGHGGARPRDFFERGIHLEESVTIRRSPSEIYEFWRRFENLPRFMGHVDDVQVMDDRRSHWVVRGPGGRRFEWDAEIINEEANRLISWKSRPGTSVDNAGTVTFREAPEGTDLHVVMDYLPPAGRLGVAVAELLGESPRSQIREDLQRLRDILEQEPRKPETVQSSETDLREQRMEAEGGPPGGAPGAPD